MSKYGGNHETNFPDAVFRSYVSDNFDTNEDGNSFGDLCLDSAVMIIAAPPAPEGSSNMFRLYNPNSGEHSYTSNSGERNHLIRPVCLRTTGWYR